jgi:hypothetical protein
MSQRRAASETRPGGDAEQLRSSLPGSSSGPHSPGRAASGAGESRKARALAGTGLSGAGRWKHARDAPRDQAAVDPPLLSPRLAAGRPSPRGLGLSPLSGPRRLCPALSSRLSFCRDSRRRRRDDGVAYVSRRVRASSRRNHSGAMTASRREFMPSLRRAEVATRRSAGT